MRGIDRHRREHGIHAAVVEILSELRRYLWSSSRSGQDPDGLLGQRGQQFFVPAFVLVADEDVHRGGNFVEFFFGGQPVGADFAGAVLDALEKTGNADFDELVEIAGGDRQKLDALE